MIAFIDGGTTNSRVFLVEDGKVVAQGSRKVGVKDTAIRGSNQPLQDAIREAVFEALSSISRDVADIQCFITSGMITSEIGLLEIPHIVAPVTEDELAGAVVKVRDIKVFPFDIPVVFIRGIKNSVYGQNNKIQELRKIDFMRGEEVQAFGILHAYDPKPPVNIIVIGSHTKLVHIDASRRIAGSLTTISGQFYDSLIQGTFIGKCVQDDGEQQGSFTEDEILDTAIDVIKHGGLLRAMLMPRFMQVLMKTTAAERRYFINACIAAEDVKILDEAADQGFVVDADYYLFGAVQMCGIYKKLIDKKFGGAVKVVSITDKERIRDITIQGALGIARKSGVVLGLS